MQWQIVVALIVAVPVILMPVVFVWFLNIGALRALREKRKREAAVRAGVPVETDTR